MNLDLEVAPPTQVLGVSQKWGAPPNSGVNPRAALDIGVPPQTMGVCPPPKLTGTLEYPQTLGGLPP